MFGGWSFSFPHGRGGKNLPSEVVFTAVKFYPPDVLDAWKEALEERTHQTLIWKYINGQFAELSILQEGYPDIIDDLISLGILDLESFAQKFAIEKPR